MEITLTDSVDEGKWNGAVRKHGTSVTQMHLFSEIYELKGMKSSFIIAEEKGELVGGAQIFRKPGFPARTIAISPFGNNRSTVQKVIDALKLELKKTFINYVILENDDPNTSLFKEFFHERKATVIVRLDKSLDDLRKNLDKKARWGVNKAEKELTIAAATSESEWKEFYTIYCETCHKDKIAPITYPELALIKKKAADAGLATLILVKKEGMIIAGSLLYHFKHASTHSLNGSKKEFLESQPNNLLYWKMIEVSKERGVERFNLGGYALDVAEGTPLAGINRFKMRWGGELVHFNIYSASRFYFPLIKGLKRFGVLR